MRLLVLSLCIVVLVGCSKGEVKAPSSPTQQSSASTPAEIKPAVPMVLVVLNDVYLACQPSREAAREVLSRLPGVTDLQIDPASRQIRLHLPKGDKKDGAFAGFDFGPAESAASALHLAGLHGKWSQGEVGATTTFQIVGKSISDAFDTPVSGTAAAVTLRGAFAASPESQQAIRKALAPAKVTFSGENQTKTIRIQGKDLSAAVERDKLNAAGFHAFEFNER